MSNAFYTLLAILICLTFNLNAQDKGSVSIHSDPRLALLLSKTRPVEKDEEEAPAQTKIKNTKKNITAALPTHGSARKDMDRPVASAARDMPVSTKELTKTKTAVPPVENINRKKDERLLVKEPKHLAIGMSRGGRYSGDGYRVQIYNGTDREKALQIKSDFMRNYPGVQTYLTYHAPHYRVKVGDYRRREDATSMFKETNGTYSPCMIVPDVVSIR